MLSVVQTSLFDLTPTDHLALGPLGGMITRQPLGRGAWVDVLARLVERQQHSL